MFLLLRRGGRTIKDAAQIAGQHFEGASIPYRTAQRWESQHREAERTGIGFALASRADAQPAVGSAPSSPEGGAFNGGASPTADGEQARAAMPGLALSGPGPHERPTMDALIRSAVAGAGA
jgi:hypothetical protein